MKTKRFSAHPVVPLFLSLLLLIMPVTSCDDTTPTGSGINGPMGNLVTTHGCKAFITLSIDGGPGPNQECVEYLYDKAGVLQLTHINAAFNCCPGEITADIDIERRVITITEYEEMQQCRCNCLFDVDYTIENLPPGEYEIRVLGPYQEEDDDPLEFTANLILAPEGVFCVDRNHYPWFVNVPPEPQGMFLTMKGCLDFPAHQTTETIEGIRDCLEYSYLPGNVLLLWHRNAGFNCCPMIDTSIDIDNNTITITETDSGLCDCLCLYDLSYQIVNLPPGEYTITVVEPYLQPGDEALEFSIDLNLVPNDMFCVDRTHYPWR